MVFSVLIFSLLLQRVAVSLLYHAYFHHTQRLCMTLSGVPSRITHKTNFEPAPALWRTCERGLINGKAHPFSKSMLIPRTFSHHHECHLFGKDILADELDEASFSTLQPALICASSWRPESNLRKAERSLSFICKYLFL